MDITRCTTELEQFRYTLYQNFDNRADTLLELVDAICSTPQANSVVEYSLSASFRRSYSSLFKGVNEALMAAMLLPRGVAPYLPRPTLWPFWLLMVDVTPQPRPYAHTLADRGMVYQPEVVKGKLPVTIGHQFSTVALGLAPEAGISPSWVVPLLTGRVATAADKERVGAEQVDALLADASLPFGQALCVEVADTSYSKPAYLHAHRHHANLVTIARVRSNRTFYRQYVPGADEKPRRGHPTWYGERFCLADSQTWSPPDETLTVWETSRRGQRQRVEIQAWHNLLMSGQREPEPLPMHRYPFTLVRIVRYDEQGQPLYKHPLWLLVMGHRRQEVTLSHVHAAYRHRFDLEHFFRFGKQKLRLTAFQTPEVQREETWWHLVHIAYAQLWMARHLVQLLPRPWERHLPTVRRRLISPTWVQRDFGRIIRQLGTPAQPPKRRGISPGRRPGTKLPPRPHHKVVVKGRNKAA